MPCEIGREHSSVWYSLSEVSQTPSLALSRDPITHREMHTRSASAVGYTLDTPLVLLASLCAVLRNYLSVPVTFGNPSGDTESLRE